MTARTVQLVLHYDGSAFAGWQRQPKERTVQGELEQVLTRLTGSHVAALGAGRTDAGVHARGQAVGVRVPERWSAANLRRALNALLPRDIWVAAAHEMRPDFHARYRARWLADTATTWELTTKRDRRSAATPSGRSRARSIARCSSGRRRPWSASTASSRSRFVAPRRKATTIAVSCGRRTWRDRDGGLVFEIEANRFLHHMVRFLVGTMVEVASGRRENDAVDRLLASSVNDDVSPPAPAHALFLDRVTYPSDLYLQPA